jgi:predicted dinucleotide-binding enzyme
VKVVKALNTMNCDVMVDPTRVPGEHHVFMCGEEHDAKTQVSGVLREFGWPADHILDLGGISAARGTELYVALWLRSGASSERGSSISRSCVRTRTTPTSSDIPARWGTTTCCSKKRSRTP